MFDPTDTIRKHKSSPDSERSKGLLYLKVAGAIFVCSLTAGYLSGKAASPQYNDPTRSPAFIRRVLRNRSDKSPPTKWIVERYEDGRVKSFHPEIPSLSFTCGVEVRNYDTQRNSITKSAAPGNPSAEVPRLGISYPDMMGFLLGGTGSYTALYAARTSGESAEALLSGTSTGGKILRIGGIIVLSGVGFGIGYFIGFDDSIPCGEPLFRQLLDDPTFWQGVTSDFVADHDWLIEYSDQFCTACTSRHFDQAGAAQYEKVFNDWPEWAKPTEDIKFRELGQLNALRSPVVRIRTASWHIATLYEFDIEAAEAHVSEEILNQRSLSSLSTATTFACQSYQCLPEQLR